MSTIVYPATSNSEAIELNISNANQFFTILRGGPDDSIPTFEGFGEVPSVAKALAEAAAYKTPLPWQTTGTQSDILQPRVFNDEIYVPLKSPASFGTTPSSSDWRLLTPYSIVTQIVNLFNTDELTSRILDLSSQSLQYSPGTGNLVVFVGREFQVPGVDYNEISTTAIEFTYDPTANTDITIIIGQLVGEAGDAAAFAAAAEDSADSAALSETNAATSEVNAAASATAAGQSETNAGISETNAATSEANAATSEANAATSEANAAASAAAAEDAAVVFAIALG